MSVCHSGTERSEGPGIHNPSARTMDSGFAAPRRPGMTVGYGHEKQENEKWISETVSAI